MKSVGVKKFSTYANQISFIPDTNKTVRFVSFFQFWININSNYSTNF